SQERYVLGMPVERVAEFTAICERERCPFAVVGHATAEERLVVGYGATIKTVYGEAAADSLLPPAGRRGALASHGSRDDERLSAMCEGGGAERGARRADEGPRNAAQDATGNSARPHPSPLPQAGEGAEAPHADSRPWPIDLPMDLLFGKAPKMQRDTRRPDDAPWPSLDWSGLDLHDAALRVMAHPTVGSKQFLITIGDRSVGGLTARDQMVGPWQVPVADCAITFAGFDGFTGEAM